MMKRRKLEEFVYCGLTFLLNSKRPNAGPHIRMDMTPMARMSSFGVNGLLGGWLWKRPGVKRGYSGRLTRTLVLRETCARVALVTNLLRNILFFLVLKLLLFLSGKSTKI